MNAMVCPHRGLALLLTCCSVLTAGAQSYPERPVRMIIPYSAGGATDTVTRIVAQRLPEVLGQQVVVDNRPGAGSLIGTDIAAKAPPDGYTLFASGSPLVIVPHLYKKVPYDIFKDFAPILQFGSQPYVLVIHPSLPAKTLKELIALAQQQPGKIDYASSGNGGAQHLFAAMFVSMAKIDMRHIPYKGSGPATADLLGGQVKVGCQGIASALPHHKAGRLHILAVTSAKRSPQLPDIPSIAETVAGYEATLWSGLLAPRGVPVAIIKRLNGDVTKVMQMPDVQSAFAATGTDVVVTTPQAFGELLKIEFDKWGKVIREIKLEIN